jgi:hypothetical protein
MVVTEFAGGTVVLIRKIPYLEIPSIEGVIMHADTEQPAAQT